MATDLLPTPGVGVVVADERGIVAVRKAFGPFEGLWGVPGGKIEYGETMVEAAHREVMEETGLEIELGDVVWAGENIGPGDPPAWHFTIVDFLAVPTGGDVRPGDDASEVRWVDIATFRALPLIPGIAELFPRLEVRHE